jgi:hypothetical protein
MKSKLLSVFLLLIGSFTWSQTISFGDEKLYLALLQHTPKVDLNDDKFITLEEANQVSVLKLSGFNLVKIDELKHFKNLVELVLTNNTLVRCKRRTTESADINRQKRGTKMPTLRKIKRGVLPMHLPTQKQHI